MRGGSTTGLLWLFLLLVAVSGAASAGRPDGARLFARYCSACHGADGRGGVGVPLALPAFQASVSDRYLRRTIRHGRPGRVMPAFRRLSDAQVDAIVTYIRSWYQGPRPVWSPARIQGDVAHGKVLFARHCAGCHGDHGQGGHGTGVTFSRPRDLPIMPPALNNPGFQVAASDRMIKETLMKGRKGTPMRSFLAQGLSERDIDDLVAFVRTLGGAEDQVEALAKGKGEPAVLVYESPYSVKETVEAVKRAVVGENFRLIRIQTLEDGLFPRDRQTPDQVIVYFCNFNFLYKALAIDPRVGLFLPCRVTVVKRNGKVLVMAANPRKLSPLFNNRELNQACDRMHQVYIDILEEATL